MNCPRCQAEVAVQHAFCMKCGARLAVPPPPAAEAPPIGTQSQPRFPDGATQTLRTEVETLAPGPLRDPAAHAVDPTGERPTATAVERGPKLEVQQLRHPRSGSRVTLVGRVRWRLPAGSRPLLEVDGPAHSHPVAIHFDGADWAPFAFELHPQQPGGYRITFRIDGPEGEDYEGEHLLQIEPESDAAQIIQIHNQQTNEARIAVGQEAHINVHVAGREEHRPGEPVYLPVLLHRVGAAPVAQVVSGVKRPWKPYVPAREPVTRLCLRIRQGHTTRNICLLGGSVLRIGKQRGQNDVVLRIVPLDPQFDLLWGRVSRRHAELQFTPTGAEWRNLDCGNGTFVDGHVLGPRQAVPVRHNQLFRPASVVELELQCALIPTCPADVAPEAYEQFTRKLGPATLPHEPVGPCAGLRLTRVRNCGHLEEYLLLQRGCSLGSDAGNGLVIPDPSLGLVHAGLHYTAHGFWLEPIQQQSPTLVDGQPVPLHRLIQLIPGMSPLQLGNVQIGVASYQQWYVDVAPTEYR